MGRGCTMNYIYFSCICLDSINLFKGDCYWKFMFPGSAPEPGYPRSMATDWLDCPNSSLPMPGDLSLSSHPARRQEVHERWREERVGHVAEREGEDEETRGREYLNRIRDGGGEQSRPQLCTCSIAPVVRTTPVSIALLLGRWILSAI